MSSAVVAAVAKPIAPPSHFAELLRRSRFATYDPAIRQTYSSPAAHVHRGDWGIKRPLSLRKRNTFVSFSSFEHRAQFTDWNYAENEARFIRRVEEMGTRIVVSEQSSWYQAMGDAKTQWPLDSEFCPGEESVDAEVNEKRLEMPVSLDPVNLGTRGPGQYGSNRPLHRKPQQPIPNYSAMTEKQFKRYLRKLRALQPEFKEYLKAQTDKSVYELTKEGVHPHHFRFLSHHTAQEYRDPNTRKIKDQPHPNAALMYARTTPLSSSLTTEPQPGIMLQPYDKKTNLHRFTGPREGFLASFGGLIAFVDKSQAGGREALFYPSSEHAIDGFALNNSVGAMRMERIKIHQHPRVVGRRAQSFPHVQLECHAVVPPSYAAFGTLNGEEPGTPEYIAKEASRKNPLQPANFQQDTGRGSYIYDKNKAREQSKATIDVLKTMVTTRPGTNGDP